MGVPKGFLVVPIGFRSDGTLRTLELTDSDELKVYIASTVLDDMLTALEKIDDLQGALDSIGTDEIDVNVEESVLPTGAATSAAQATALTELQAKLETADLELVSKILSNGPHGWVGGAWQRNPLLLGYSGDKTGDNSNADTAAGDILISGTIVPAGEIWVISTITAKNNASVCSKIELSVNINGLETTIFTEVSPAALKWVSWTGQIVLSENDYVVVRFYGCVLHDDIYVRYQAARVDIDQ